MTLARWLIAGSWLLLFWLLAATVWAPAIQRELTRSAQSLVTPANSSYPPLEVTFQGQQAILRGKVRHPEERTAAEARVRSEVRTASTWAARLDRNFNPVTEVINEIEVAPFPPGWLLLAAKGPYAELSGTAASEFEARDAAAQIEERWTARGGRLDAQVGTDSARFDETSAAERTLAAVPAPLPASPDSAQIQIARLGTGWHRLSIEATDAQLHAQVLALGLTDTEWAEHVLPAILATRKHQQTERTRAAQVQTQAALPPAHLFIAARDHRLLLIGETATLAIKRELLNSVIATFPDWKIIDDIRVNPQRRAEGEFGPITTALLPIDDEAGTGKSLMLGFAGQAWQPVDWQVARDARPWESMLPKDLSGDLLAKDSTIAVEWLQGSPRGIPAMQLRAQPSFLTLTLLPDRVILAGQLAEESLRTQLVEAARQAYEGRATVMTEALLARGTCEPSPDVLQTTRSLPPLPGANDPVLVAFARPGLTWKSLQATPEMLRPGGLAETKLLPVNFPAAMAEDTFAEAFELVRAFWEKRAETAPPDPGTQ